MKPIYHIASEREIAHAARTGEYVPAELRDGGFIHACYADQLSAVAESKFRGRVGLLLFEIDPARLTCAVVNESASAMSQHFPHIYGPLPMSAVTAIREISVPMDGPVALPCGISDAQ